MPRLARLVGSVSSAMASDHLPETAVASIAVDRGLRGGSLDVVALDEMQLANLVADGAVVLARLAKSRVAS